MDAREHYAEAEACIKRGQTTNGPDALIASFFAEAQVHATLALAAATMARADREMVEGR